jgi:hypothetical protein
LQLEVGYVLPLHQSLQLYNQDDEYNHQVYQEYEPFEKKLKLGSHLVPILDEILKLTPFLLSN